MSEPIVTISAAAARDLYSYGEGLSGDAADGWTLLVDVKNAPRVRTSSWHERYWLLVQDQGLRVYGVEYGIGLTGDQENDLPWDERSAAELPLTRLYPHTVVHTEYRTTPA